MHAMERAVPSGPCLPSNRDGHNLQSHAPNSDVTYLLAQPVLLHIHHVLSLWCWHR